MNNNDKKYLTREEFFEFLKADQKKWEENQKKWEENERKWQENQKVIRDLINKFDKRFSRLGSRFGVRLESFSRELIRIFLEENGINKNNIKRLVVRDDKGKVFGFPEEIEIDIFMKEPMVVGEITGFLDEKDKLYNFNRKVELIEELYNNKAKLKFIGCLDIEPRIKNDINKIANKLGIKILLTEEQ